MAEVEVLHPGLFSSIQDKGRRSFLEYGVPTSGPMDSFSFGMANLLLENPDTAAVLEITQMGPELRFSEAAQVVICGALISPQVDGMAVKNNEVINLTGENVLSFGRRIRGSRAYIGIAGGFCTEEVLESRSWYPGITAASRLQKGMKLHYYPSFDKSETKNALIKTDDQLFSKQIETLPGPEFHLLSPAQQEEVEKRSFTVSMASNRMGVQLQETLHNDLQSILSAPVLPGTVQLTPSGRLIVLMRDAQTTGGYPRILQLSERGINTLAQKVPGEEVCFRMRRNKGAAQDLL